MKRSTPLSSPIAAIALLVACATVTVHAQRPKAAAAPGALTIVRSGRATVLTPTDLAKLPRHEIRLATEGSSDSATVSGITLWDVLQAVGVPAAEASGRQRAVMYVRLRGSDGQSAVLALVEIDPGFSSRSALVADRRNGQPLDDSEGPWRVIIPDDMRHARWIRGLVSIEISSLTP